MLLWANNRSLQGINMSVNNATDLATPSLLVLCQSMQDSVKVGYITSLQRSL